MTDEDETFVRMHQMAWAMGSEEAAERAAGILAWAQTNHKSPQQCGEALRGYTVAIEWRDSIREQTSGLITLDPCTN